MEAKTISEAPRLSLAVVPELGPALMRGATSHWPSQYFADQLTLFEPGRADYPQLLLLAPQCFAPSGTTVMHLMTKLINGALYPISTRNRRYHLS